MERRQLPANDGDPHPYGAMLGGINLPGIPGSISFVNATMAWRTKQELVDGWAVVNGAHSDGFTFIRDNPLAKEIIDPEFPNAPERRIDYLFTRDFRLALPPQWTLSWERVQLVMPKDLALPVSGHFGVFGHLKMRPTRTA
jgi:hypothetical protein